jgi:hypothetical protein
MCAESTTPRQYCIDTYVQLSMNAAQQRAEAERIVNAAGANAAPNSRGVNTAANTDASAAQNAPPVAPAAVLPQVVFGNDQLLWILAAMRNLLRQAQQPQPLPSKREQPG